MHFIFGILTGYRLAWGRAMATKNDNLICANGSKQWELDYKLSYCFLHNSTGTTQHNSTARVRHSVAVYTSFEVKCIIKEILPS